MVTVAARAAVRAEAMAVERVATRVVSREVAREAVRAEEAVATVRAVGLATVRRAAAMGAGGVPEKVARGEASEGLKVERVTKVAALEAAAVAAAVGQVARAAAGVSHPKQRPPYKLGRQ